MSRTLRTGDQGGDVRALQVVLNFHIRRLQPLTVDGKFGSLTRQRVVEFQKANSLQADGAVGQQTNRKLFENEAVTFTLGIVPALLLSLPKIAAGARQPAGIRPPTLIPPLVLPGQPQPAPAVPGSLPIPVFTPFQLRPASFSRLPSLNSRGQLLNLTLTVPARNDPVDPAVRSFRQTVQLLETLPADFPFRTIIIGAVPNPVKKIGDPGSGFQWGVAPVFDLKKLTGPTEFTVAAKASAGIAVRVINQQRSGGLKLGIFAKGDFKGELDYTSEKATSRPLLLLEGSIAVGVEGRI
jgi:peptidoglycan hydrolase-like protein with peptidoglycan-binding domain